MAPIKRSFYGRVRSTAYELWRGSDRLANREDDNFCGGYRILRLALRQGTSSDPQIEARAAYAYLASETPPDAILRAMFWDSKTVVRKSRDDPPADTPFTIPAKFVQIPITQVRQWVQKFDGLQTSLQVVSQEDDSLPICSLRIETNYVDNVFEKVWRVLPGERDALTRLWLEVWHEMGHILQTYPAITGIEESFPCVEGRPEVYDFQAYEPSLTLS